jgi:hypothetical protein
VYVDIADPGTLSMKNGVGMWRGRGQMSREAICEMWKSKDDMTKSLLDCLLTTRTRTPIVVAGGQKVLRSRSHLSQIALLAGHEKSKSVE